MSSDAVEPQFLPGVPVDRVRARLAAAGGKEIESGKLASPESSAALAVNAFGWFIERPDLLPPFPGTPWATAPSVVDVEYCARFPWSGGRHPWLDAIVETGGELIGVESKRFEPFRDRKSVALSAAYDRPVWGEGMQPYERVRDGLRSATLAFEYLDAAQLVKHAFGLVTEGRRKHKAARLHYLFAEPERLAGRPVPASALAAHRSEVAAFAEAVAGAAVAFTACSYREWLATWSGRHADIAAHGERLEVHFRP